MRYLIRQPVLNSLCHTFDHFHHWLCGILRIQKLYGSGSTQDPFLCLFLGLMSLSSLLITASIHEGSPAIVLGFIGLLGMAIVVYRVGDRRVGAPNVVWLRWTWWKQLRHSVYIPLRISPVTHCNCLEVKQGAGGETVKWGMGDSKRWENLIL